MPLWAVQVSAQSSDAVMQERSGSWGLSSAASGSLCILCPQQRGQRVVLGEQKTSRGFCWEQPHSPG